MGNSAKQRNNKTMSDTPETDNLLKVNIPELVDLCRKMERERNDARDSKWAREIHSCHNACARPMCVLRRERDEWREKAERLQTACNKWSESEMPLTNCPDCKQFRGHGHQCKSEPPPARNCRECCGQGQVEIQSGPYMTQCPECNGTGKQTNQPKP